MESWRISLVAIAIALLMATLVSAGEDKAKDKEECTEQLVGMATCLPYVQGQAKTPTPDCCSGLKQVLKSDKKCLCVIIQDRNDPDLGLQINVSLALALPSVCHAVADVTKCPALLHMDPKSQEAQVFYQLANGLNKSAPGSAPAPTSISPTAGSEDGNNSGRATSLPSKNHAQSIRKRWLVLEVAAHLFIISFTITL
ncbi:hypothetical protein DY000_02028676 [Brassica cretica]|uniref:Bifunctional inhibitor/plant lipid transfer protein/seed storage helical domain-containing protein n=1 Tax=Brassica cretica TaxID=69181 RepID=A0ABQ7DP25_BRACR|nr:hypothetical protein DY000_02028676 [Brassica cretica]